MKLLEKLQASFLYNSETGEFKRIDRKGSNGSIDKDGYLILKIKGKQYKAHRMAWLYVYGTLPKFNIDHINRIRLDNRIENLRDVSQSDNVKNTTRTINKDTGVIGISLDKTTKGLKSKFTLRKNKKVFRFRTLEEALLIKNNT
jgi:citrate synthase